MSALRKTDITHSVAVAPARSFAAPAIHLLPIVETEADGHHILKPAGAGASNFFVQHFHGVTGATAIEWKFARTLAGGGLGHRITVVMPQSDKLAARPKSEQLRSLYQLARYAVDLPRDLQLPTFNEGAGVMQKWMNVANTVFAGVPMWYSFAFDPIAAVQPETVSNAIDYWGSVSNGMMGLARSVADAWMPKLAPNIAETIPRMLAVAAQIRAVTDDMLRRLDVKGNLIMSGYSQGVGIAAPSALLNETTDANLRPGLLVASNAPIILTHGVPPIRNRVPTHNILPRDDGIASQVLGIGADDVRRHAAQQDLPFRVHTPPGRHDLPCRLVLAIMKRHMDRWQGPPPAPA